MKYIIIIFLLMSCQKDTESILIRIETSKPSEIHIRKFDKKDKSKEYNSRFIIIDHYENMQDNNRYYEYNIDCDSGTNIKAYKNGKLIYNVHANHHEIR